MRPKVFGVTCTADGWLHKLVAMAWMRMLQDPRFELRVSFPVHRPFENALNHAVVDFLASDAEWFLNLDSDQSPSANPMELILLNYDCTGIATPVYHCEASKPNDRCYYLNAYKRSETEDGWNEFHPQDGIREVDAVGSGILLVHRRVFEDPVIRTVPFRRTTDLVGRVEYGPDLQFCKRIRERGFKVWCDFTHISDHMVEVPLLEAIQAFGRLHSNPSSV